jgi:aspartokinase/homoserine dehydrogenase 1
MRGAPPDWALEAIASSTGIRYANPGGSCGGIDAESLADRVSHDLNDLPERLTRRPALAHVIVDATASQDVAARHVHWLARGIHVVTANKLALADAASSWSRLQEARRRASYAASATVGAGLPVLSVLERLRRAGEPVLSIRAVLSGSLSFICSQLNAGRPASAGVLAAHEQGLSEPDPRSDLSGLDVARKLVILARAAGQALSIEDIAIESLVPESLSDGSLEVFFDRIGDLDAAIRERVDAAPGRGERVAYLAQLGPEGRAVVGLQRVASEDAMSRCSAIDNRIEIITETYRDSPLVIAGPGAGVDVTALALYSDLLRVSESGRSDH